MARTCVPRSAALGQGGSGRTADLKNRSALLACCAFRTAQMRFTGDLLPQKGAAFSWSFYISARATLNGETMGNSNFLPSPLWGRGWLAYGVLISRGGPGEGVESVSSPHPYRKTRSLARTAGQIDKARALRRSSTEAEQAAWPLLRKLRLKGFRFRRQHPVGPYIADFLLPGASPYSRARRQRAWAAEPSEQRRTTGCVPESPRKYRAASFQRQGFRSAGAVCGKSGGHGMVATGGVGLSRFGF